MNLSDLTDVLRDHAELDDTAHDARMAGIRARVIATRRRIALAGVFCLVLALVSAVYLTLPRPVEPAHRTRSLPEYHSGARLVEQAWADLPANSVTVEYIPTSDEQLMIFGRCSIDQHLVMVIVINGRVEQSGNCSSASTLGPGTLAGFGGAVGKPLTITMLVGVSRVADQFPDKAEDLRPPGEAVSGEFAVGVGVRVPVSEYSFPPRPETLENLDDLTPPGGINIRSDRRDPDAPQTLDVEWPGPFHVNAALNTPGRLEVLVNGTVVYNLDSWDYGGISGITTVGKDDGLQFTPGQVVTITVVPERTTGDWNVQFAEYD